MGTAMDMVVDTAVGMAMTRGTDMDMDMVMVMTKDIAVHMAMTRGTDMRAVMTKDTAMAMTTTITGMIMDTVMDMDMMTTTDTKGRDTLITMHMVTSTGRMVTNTATMVGCIENNLPVPSMLIFRTL